MVAKAAGTLVGVLIMLSWFWLVGTVPIMETVVGLLLGLGGGVFAWLVLDRYMGGSGGRGR